MKKNSLKENPMMMSRKARRMNKGLSVATEDEMDIKSFIIILVVIVLIIVGIYFVTSHIQKKNEVEEPEVTAGEIDYEITSVGTILNRPYEEYYVLVYDSKDSAAVKYSSLMARYISNSSAKDYIKIYYCDLNNNLNKPYYNVNNDNKSNPKATKVKDFDFGALTLLKIKDGKITNYIEDYKTIQEKLK